MKEGTIPLVPQLVPICQKLTSYPAYYGGRFFFFDPTDAGLDWQIKTGKVDTLFYLEPCHEKETKIETCPDWLMVQKLMLQSSDFGGNPEGQIGELCHLVDRSNNFIIHLGELDSAVMLLKNISCLSGCHPKLTLTSNRGSRLLFDGSTKNFCPCPTRY